jgi:hypothetical protein
MYIFINYVEYWNIKWQTDILKYGGDFIYRERVSIYVVNI